MMQSRVCLSFTNLLQPKTRKSEKWPVIWYPSPTVQPASLASSPTARLVLLSGLPGTGPPAAAPRKVMCLPLIGVLERWCLPPLRCTEIRMEEEEVWLGAGHRLGG